MPTVKSFAIGNGDMFYIKHGSDNFTIIDCCLTDDRMGSILAELSSESKNKGITRFISTHPDQDHISGLEELDEHLNLINFYVVKNNVSKSFETADFKRYKALRDGDHAYYISKGCTRKWMNIGDEERGSAGLNVWWPITSNPDFQSALADAAAGLPPNNISCIVSYSVEDGPSMLWLGDLETDFMEKITEKVPLRKVDIVFAPHHGRDSGKLPKDWLSKLNPELIVIGEAQSAHLNYYAGYNTMTQNSCGDILFETRDSKVDIFVSDSVYSVDYLADDGLDHSRGLYYVGTLYV